MGITHMTEPWSDAETFATLEPLVRDWFLAKFAELSPPQRYSIKNIHDGVNTLISSPTGSGKTISAFLSILNKLLLLQERGELEQKVYCVYLSPLKALANDITKNLKEPLKELKELARERKRKLDITVGTRTGDTTASQRGAMLKKPPHILITTPESLAISLTTIKFREMLRTTEFIIIDEIHSLAESKRGVHLSLSMERLEELVTEREPGKMLVRIGLSATVSPLEEMAKFLVGLDDPTLGRYRGCRIVDVQAVKRHDLKVLCPVSDIMRSSHAKTQAAMFELLHELIQSHKTTLVFTNTRAATERIVHGLKGRYPKHYAGILDGDAEEDRLERETEAEFFTNQRTAEERAFGEGKAQEERGAEEKNGAYGERTGNRKKGESEERRLMTEPASRRGGSIGAHHGSLSKTHRLAIENRLKRGELKAVVCSTSLELGIDIGSIDLVVLLGSPKSVARALQRIGRSGHQLHEEAKGRIIVLDRDDMVECSVLLKAAIERKIDRVHIPMNALDVLAQQLFGFAIERVRGFEELYRIVRRSHCYHALGRGDFEEVVKYLAGEYAELEERAVYAKIWWDKESGNVGKRGKLARLISLTNVGTIPDETNVTVKIGETVIGTIDEGFLERLKPGDVFVLGGETYEFRFSRGLTAQVKNSAGRPPTVPNWVSEMLPLSYDLACEILRFRQHMDELFRLGKGKEEIIAYMDGYLYADERTLSSIYEYFLEQYRYAKVPHARRLLVEHYREGSRRHVIVHSLYGRRVNDVLSRALGFALGRLQKRDVAITITDTGFALSATVPLNIPQAVSLLKSDELGRVMQAALEKSEVLGRRFRHCAARSLMILRTYRGDQKSVGRQQMNSRLLLSAVKRIGDDFPVLKEARREVLEDLMDIAHAAEVLRSLEEGSLKVEEISTVLPSPFAFNIILQGYGDILKLEDRVAFLQRMHAMILAEIDGKAEEGKERGGTQKGSGSRARKKPAFSYEEVWREAEERRLAERNEEKEGLIKAAWNLPRVPLFAKEEFVKVIEGAEEVRPDVRQALEQHKEEIVRTWPAGLVRLLFSRLGLPFEETKLAAEEERSLLRRQWLSATRKAGLESGLVHEGGRLIDGEKVTDTAFWRFVDDLLKGTVPKAWGDELVKFLRRKRR